MLFGHAFPAVSVTACLLAGCATTPSPAAPSRVAPSAATVESAQNTAAAPAECELHCELPQMLPRASSDPDYTQAEINDANVVLASMRDDLLACYEKRVRAVPNAHGFITVDIAIGDDGRVRRVATTGGAILGEGAMSCIVHRIERGQFEPPHGGGTLHVRVPFSLRRVVPGEEA